MDITDPSRKAAIVMEGRSKEFKRLAYFTMESYMIFMETKTSVGRLLLSRIYFWLWKCFHFQKGGVLFLFLFSLFFLLASLPAVLSFQILLPNSWQWYVKRFFHLQLSAKRKMVRLPPITRIDYVLHLHSHMKICPHRHTHEIEFRLCYTSRKRVTAPA